VSQTEAQRKASREYYLRNKAKVSAYHKERYLRDVEGNRAQRREYASSNNPARLKYNKRWAKEDNRRRPWVKAYHSAKQRAKKKDIAFDLTPEYLESIWTDTCPIFGIELVVGAGVKDDASYSLDRIVPEKGYIQGNIVVVSLKANRMKNNGTIDDIAALYEFYSTLLPQAPQQSEVL
jgi:hypothetical protein